MCPSYKFSVGAGHGLRRARSFMQNSRRLEYHIQKKTVEGP
jgi:hypothetical protein